MNIQYEYRITEFGPVYDYTRHLNNMGEKGWELCAVGELLGGSRKLYWKRRKFGERVEPRHDPIEPIKPDPEVKPHSWRDEVINEHFGRGDQEHSAVMEAIGH